jgi:hypothetical protein
MMSDKLIPLCPVNADDSVLRHRKQNKAIKATAGNKGFNPTFRFLGFDCVAGSLVAGKNAGNFAGIGRSSAKSVLGPRGVGHGFLLECGRKT